MYAPAQWFDVTLKGTFQGQVIINHFYYGCAELGLPYGGPVVDVATDFANIVLPLMLPLLSVGTVFDSIDIEEHVSGTAVATLALTAGNSGTAGGDALPAFNALSFRSVRTSSQVPRAQKRFGGLSELTVTNGVLNPAAQPDVDALVAILNEAFNPLNGGVTDVLPLAITRVDNTVTPHVPRPVPLFDGIVAWQYRKVSSQVSRRA